VANVLGGHAAGATTVTLDTGEGAKLPDVTGTFTHAYAWWFDSTNYASARLDPNREIVKITNRATDTLTVVRAQQGTAATAKNTPAAQYVMVSGATAGEWTALYEQMVERSACYAKLSAAQTIGTGASTLVTLDEERFDKQGDYNIGTYKFTAPYDMVISVQGQCTYKTAVDQTEMQSRIFVNAAVVLIATVQATGTGDHSVLASATLDINATDTVSLEAFQNSGGNVDLDDNDAKTYLCVTEIMRLS
jgi:hypothetical protein